MIRGAPAVFAALLAVLAGGALFYLALRTDPDADEVIEDPPRYERDSEAAPPERDDDPVAAQPADGTEPPTNAPGESVPRILPADAALEDVRDAFVAGDVEALTRAYEQLIRLSSTRRALIMQELPTTDGASVRGIALAALGVHGRAADLDWIASRLGASGFPSEQLGALIGLCSYKAEATERVAIERWHRLGVPIGPIAERPRVWENLQRLLDRAPGSSDAELLALVGHALMRAPASVFVDAQGALRPWLGDRPRGETERVRADLASRADLDQRTLRALQ